MTTETQQHKKRDTLAINANGTLPLNVVEKGQALELDLLSTASQHFWHNLTPDIRLHGVDKQGKPVVVMPVVDATKRYVRFAFGTELDPLQPMQLRVNGQPISEFICENGKLGATDRHVIYQLAIHETRGMGKRLNPSNLLPYDRASREGFDEALHAPITDLHTHVSSQISAADLFKLSLDLDKKADQEAVDLGDSSRYVTYPIELLEKLKVPAEASQKLYEVPAYEFKPLQHEKLVCESGQPADPHAAKRFYKAIRLSEMTPKQRRAVIQAMDAPQDGTKSFQQVEEDIYRHTTPLTRNPHLTKPLLRKIAENYAAQGIQHAELATSSLMNPQWFEAMVEAVNSIEHGPDAITVGPDKKPFTMRFMVGLPRKYGPTATMEALERTKFLAQHPYIVGIDLMGNETGKTSDFHWALSHMAMWARKSENTRLNPNDGWNFKEDFIIRVHAGESAKNPRNVADAIQIAHEHKVRVRVGHAQNADLQDADKSKLAYMKAQEGKKDSQTGEQNPRDWLAFEKCSDSNVFYRMRPLAHHVIIKPHSDMAHCVLGQDGNGLAHTSPRQTAYAGIAAGLTLDDLSTMRRYEEGYIERQRERDVRKTAAFEKTYPEGFAQFAKAYRAFDPKAAIAKRFEDKVPILIGGASDSSWNRLASLPQKEINQMMELLVLTLNPKTTYFLLGRVEGEGVSKALDRAVKRHNLAHPSNKFYVKARFGHAVAEAPTGELAETISGFESIVGGMDVVADSQIDYVRKHGGKALFFDGSQFTADMMQHAVSENRSVPCAAYVPAGNKVLANILEVFDPRKLVRSPADLLKRMLRDTGPDAFFTNQEERDRMLSPQVTITDDASCDVLLEKAEKNAKDSHVNRTRLARGKSQIVKA